MQRHLGFSPWGPIAQSGARDTVVCLEPPEGSRVEAIRELGEAGDLEDAEVRRLHRITGLVTREQETENRREGPGAKCKCKGLVLSKRRWMDRQTGKGTGRQRGWRLT